MRLIDADDLKFDVVVPGPVGASRNLLKEIAWQVSKRIDEAPTIDAVPVVHGRWEHIGNDWFDLWRCSACGEEWTFEYDPTNPETKVNYCPDCGARMDGDC